MIESLLSFVFHKYVSAPEAINVAGCFSQMVAESAIISKENVIVTVETAVPGQPFEVPVTVYEVVPEGETIILLVFSPVFQEYEAAPSAVNVASRPEQTVGELTVIFKGDPIVTVPTAVTVDPLSVAVTV
jgi:hypothetical protein